MVLIDDLNGPLLGEALVVRGAPGDQGEKVMR